VIIACSEIEEITGQLRSAGKNGIGYDIKFDAMLSTEFTKKLFKK
jgi:hypothetical protein